MNPCNLGPTLGGDVGPPLGGGGGPLLDPH